MSATTAKFFKDTALYKTSHHHSAASVPSGIAVVNGGRSGKIENSIVPQSAKPQHKRDKHTHRLSSRARARGQRGRKGNYTDAHDRNHNMEMEVNTSKEKLQFSEMIPYTSPDYQDFIENV